MPSRLERITRRLSQVLTVLVVGGLAAAVVGEAVRNPGPWITVSAVMLVMSVLAGLWVWEVSALPPLRMSQHQRKATVVRTAVFLVLFIGGLLVGDQGL